MNSVVSFILGTCLFGAVVIWSITTYNLEVSRIETRMHRTNAIQLEAELLTLKGNREECLIAVTAHDTEYYHSALGLQVCDEEYYIDN